jgi:hypothetical protein
MKLLETEISMGKDELLLDSSFLCSMLGMSKLSCDSFHDTLSVTAGQRMRGAG